MRKVVARIFMALDGVIEAPEKWQFDVMNAEAMMTANLKDWLNDIDTVLLGRNTYSEWKDYWPMNTDEGDAWYARAINQTPKYVVSTTLTEVTWGEYDTISLLKGNLAEAIHRLKAQPGKTIGVEFSAGLIRSLLQLDLLDELQLMIHPVIAGKGKRLFGDNDELKQLRLTNSQISGSGVATLTYSRREQEVT